MSGRLQVRYNLGSGEAVLQQNTIRVDDEQFHEVTLTRTEREAEIVIDGKYFNRVVSPGSEATLDIADNTMYLGAGVDSVNGTAVNGFTGCVSGFRLDRKEVPIGRDNTDFETLNIPDAVTRGCPFGSVFEVPQPDEHIYPAIAAILIALVLVSATFVAVCAISQWIRSRRTGQHRVNLRRDSTRSRRSWNFRSRNSESPVQEGFQWQSAESYKYNLSTPPGTYRSTPQHVPDPAVNFNMNNRNSVNSGSPVSGIPITEVAETGFNAPGHRASAHSQRRMKVSQPVEGFAFSQSNQAYRDDIDSGRAAGAERVQPRHLRSPSGQQSILSASTMATSSQHDDTEVTSYLGKRLDVANKEILNLNMDEMVNYKEEGPYQPLGSVGSLLDFVRELDPEYRKKTDEGYQFPVSPAVYPEVAPPNPKPRTRTGHKTRSQEDAPKTHNIKTSPLTGERFDAGNEETRELPETQPVKLREGRPRAQKHIRSSKRNSHSKRMENILERFHNITTGHQPDEGRLV